MTGAYDPIEFLESAVQQPSHESVEEMRNLLLDTLETHGIESRVDDAGNVIAERGTGRPRIILNTHIDTVPPHLEFGRDDGRILGRGSCDAKGPLAAMLDAFLSVEPASGSVVLAITPDEEVNSTGAAALDLDADAIIVGEPTGLDICTAARGRFQGTVHVQGTGAHAAEPAAGVNAISAAAQVIAGLDSFDAEFGPSPHPRLGPPTLTPTLIEGGEASNRVPSAVQITIDRRTVPPESADRFFDRLETHLQGIVADTVDVHVEPAERETPFLEAFETPEDESVVTALTEAGAGAVRAFGAATEASYFAAMAPTVVFGPGVLADDSGPVAHSEREYVEIEDVRAAARILRSTLASLVE